MELTGEHPALHAFELVLSLEKLVTLKLQDLANAAESSGDRQLSGFVDQMLSHQAEDINEAAKRVTQLRRIGANGGEALYLFDAALLKAYGTKTTAA